MKKPHLEITHSENGIPVRGKCSSCPESQVEFTALPRSAEKNQKLLERMFAEHFKHTHLREDASQAAARIVKEATERD
jgi:hypothetical protein